MLEHRRRPREIEAQVQDLGVDFGPLHAEIAAQSDSLLPLSLESMQESFDAGLAAAYTEEIDGRQVALGYCRVIPLLTPAQVRELGLPSEFPAIAELGTVDVMENRRGKGIGRSVQAELVQRFMEPIKDKNLLLIGTTKTAKELAILKKLSSIGVDFHFGRHTEFPNLAPVTCVCVPEFGSGFQLGTECPERVSESDAEVIRDTLQRSGIIMLKDVSNGVDAKIPCTMFVSDRDLAAQTDAMIAQSYGGGEDAQGAFVSGLRGINYYE